MLSLILNFLSGGIVGQIGKQLNQAYKTRLDSKNETERVEADKTIASLEARKAVLVAESRSQWNIIFRAILAVPFAAFVWKVIVWDKLLGLGTTDNLSPELWNLMMVVYGFYFVYETASLFKRT